MSIAKATAKERKKTPKTKLAWRAGLVKAVSPKARHGPVKIPNVVATSESRPRMLDA